MSRLDETIQVHRSPAELLEMAVAACRRGDWTTGLEHLETLAAQHTGQPGNLPGRYYSYLGYGGARQEKAASKKQQAIDQGIKLCRYSVKVEFFQTDNWWNLCRVYLLGNRRRAAYKALDKGLEIDPQCPELLELRKKEFGERRPQVLPFLSRSNILNRILGHLRHVLSGDGKDKAGKAAAKAPDKKPATGKTAPSRRPAPKRSP